MIYVPHQQRLALSGRAANQCPCGVFRTDGQPPTVHFTGCGLGPDGSAVGALRTDGTRWRSNWRTAARAEGEPSLTAQRRRARR